MDKQRGERLFTEAQKIINGERRDQYGDSEDSFNLLGDLWQKYLWYRHKVVCPINKKDAAFMMVLLKVARELHKHKRDNLVDMVGYLGLLDDMGLDETK